MRLLDAVDFVRGTTAASRSDRDFVVACYDGNVDAVTLMLKHGSFDSNTSTSGQSALCAAAAGVNGGRPQSDATKVRLIRLLCTHGADPNKFSWRRWSPLHYAILNGSSVVATELLDQGADVEALFNGCTPLRLLACDDPRYPSRRALTPAAKRILMRLLIDRGANPLAIRRPYCITDDARQILHRYYAIVVHLHVIGTNPSRVEACDLAPTIAAFVI